MEDMMYGKQAVSWCQPHAPNQTSNRLSQPVGHPSSGFESNSDSNGIPPVGHTPPVPLPSHITDCFQLIACTEEDVVVTGPAAPAACTECAPIYIETGLVSKCIEYQQRGAPHLIICAPLEATRAKL